MPGISPRCAWQRPRKVSLPYGQSKMFWPNETVWHVMAAAEATQGLPARSLGTYVP